mmetsp:Transcript_20746/g.30866  ORF Transcript_20746/g.30866 Transcript_20746/m.30866 type:complete len:146 (+) Transcript_20746:36-473(+)|eukprot:CAMPEP_0201552084 /NCGR_PEP_ID=MMETSP0173_2-20130828/13594_1 /ASSEMBLY_ACC=CAM_ASM_000268 /TAXON_ID=218659 /ORGANISM="Vexillifera sp., Strain DIVA3 564/2" /LENGTH=145 /DNA_ID=CAMNT_0047962501 /DNA_START=36 /DNA_END=473 /DNA_ORIENTATION=+
MAATNTKDMFDLFDKTGDGKIETSALGHVVRSLNFNPLEAEINMVLPQADPENTGFIDYATFQSVLPQLSVRPCTEKTSLETAFSVFDRNQDHNIQISELHYVLTNLGEKVSDESVDELVATAQIPPADSKADYSKFINIIVTPK